MTSAHINTHRKVNKFWGCLNPSHRRFGDVHCIDARIRGCRNDGNTGKHQQCLSVWFNLGGAQCIIGYGSGYGNTGGGAALVATMLGVLVDDAHAYGNVTWPMVQGWRV